MRGENLVLSQDTVERTSQGAIGMLLCQLAICLVDVEVRTDAVAFLPVLNRGAHCNNLACAVGARYDVILYTNNKYSSVNSNH